jgi:hypothetical protein
MFEDFAKRKFNEYLLLIEFSADKTAFQKIRSSGLPPYIINFFDCSIKNKQKPISRKEAEDTLQKAVIFNINYVIKPKATLLKFLFGDVETRPADYINERLQYFQFYSYYTEHIIEFIAINSLYVISINQIEHLINEVNKKILTEINRDKAEANRFNLVKLLYYFFLNLGPNNPINIKIPKRILSVFFNDKGFHEIKKQIDSFFAEDIFIQEAMELMKHTEKKPAKIEEEVDVNRVNEILKKAKTELLNPDSSQKDVEKTIGKDEDVQDLKVTELKKEDELRIPDEVAEKKLVLDESIYSEDLEFEAAVSEAVPAISLSEEDRFEKDFNAIFAEEKKRKKIIKKIFDKNEVEFKENVLKILRAESWTDASKQIEELFEKNGVNFYSVEAVTFVDLLEAHFIKENNGNKTDSAAV